MNKVVVKFKDDRAEMLIVGVTQINSIMGRTIVIRAADKPLNFTHAQVQEIRWIFDDGIRKKGDDGKGTVRLFARSPVDDIPAA